jgi:hypothetical protein
LNGLTPTGGLKIVFSLHGSVPEKSKKNAQYDYMIRIFLRRAMGPFQEQRGYRIKALKIKQKRGIVDENRIFGNWVDGSRVC